MDSVRITCLLSVLQLVGSQKKTSLSLSTKGGASNAFSSLLCSSDLILMTPPAYRKRALRLLAGKVALAARVDVYGPKAAATTVLEGTDDDEGDNEHTLDTNQILPEREGNKQQQPGDVGRALRDAIVQALMKARITTNPKPQTLNHKP